MNASVLTDCDLHRAGILVTRPAHQAAGLCGLIESHNGVAIGFPALEILPPVDQALPASQLHQASGIVIFVSPNAVQFGLRLLGDERLSPELTLGAVGNATAKALTDAGYRVDLVPQGRYDSEGLLALPALRRVAGKPVLIVRGVGGRPLLGESLQQRGADLVYAEVYRRACPDTDPSGLLARWSGEVSLVTATSNEVLENLRTILGVEGWPLLRRTPLLVISERMQAMAREMGFERILLAEQAADQAILQCICDWRRDPARQ